jgi:hypothetical protein
MRRIAALFAVIVFAMASAVLGARGIPEPVLVQLEEGYGVVAAEVVQGKPLPPEENVPSYAVTFKVKEVLADASGGLGLKSGEELLVELTVGYAGMVEERGSDDHPDLFPKGAKFYLTIRKNEEGKFEHAMGASAARHVQSFAPDEARLLARLRDLAAVPKDRRLDEVLKVFVDARESENLRIAAMSAMSYWHWHDRVDKPTRDRMRSAVENAWSDPKTGMTTPLMLAADYFLRGASIEWEKSDARRQVFLVHVFAPFPEEPEARQLAIRKRDEVTFFLRDDLRHQPETAKVVIENLRDAKWPAEFRSRLAMMLLHGFKFADIERPEWAQAMASGDL